MQEYTIACRGKSHFSQSGVEKPEELGDWMARRMDVWMDRQMDGWMGRPMDRPMAEMKCFQENPIFCSCQIQHLESSDYQNNLP